MKKHDIINVDITENISLGKTVAYYEGRKIHISGGYAGQNADVAITKLKEKRCEASPVKVIKKAPYQCEAQCRLFGLCGGCRFQDITYEKQLELKHNYVKQLFDRAGIPYARFEEIIPSPSVTSYRNKMEFSFGDSEKGGPLTLGLHEKSKHYDIVSVQECSISHGDFNVITKACENYFREKGATYFNKLTKTGFLRHLVLRRSTADKSLLINLVTTSRGEIGDGFCDMLNSLELEGSIAGILHTFNDSFSDAVVAEKVILLYGKDYITEKVCGLSFKIGPFSFFQTNTGGAERLYNKAIEYAGDIHDKTVFDLYCGTGTIAQTAAREAKKVYGIEIVAEAVEAAKTNAVLNNLDNCEFICGDVYKSVPEITAAPDVIIVDPPRAGLMPKAAARLAALNAQTIVYVSCKASSLVEDLAVFTAAGYEVKSVCLVDMFPHTEHVETVVLIQRKNS